MQATAASPSSRAPPERDLLVRPLGMVARVALVGRQVSPPRRAVTGRSVFSSIRVLQPADVRCRRAARHAGCRDELDRLAIRQADVLPRPLAEASARSHASAAMLRSFGMRVASSCAARRSRNEGPGGSTSSSSAWARSHVAAGVSATGISNSTSTRSTKAISSPPSRRVMALMAPSWASSQSRRCASVTSSAGRPAASSWRDTASTWSSIGGAGSSAAITSRSSGSPSQKSTYSGRCRPIRSARAW